MTVPSVSPLIPFFDSEEARPAPDSSSRYHLICEYIRTPLHALLGTKVLLWKNETNSAGRRIVFSIAFASFALIGVVDMVAGFVFGILSSPLELLGYQYSRHAFERVYLGGVASFLFLTTFQIENFLGTTEL